MLDVLGGMIFGRQGVPDDLHDTAHVGQNFSIDGNGKKANSQVSLRSSVSLTLQNAEQEVDGV